MIRFLSKESCDQVLHIISPEQPVGNHSESYYSCCTGYQDVSWQTDTYMEVFLIIIQPFAPFEPADGIPGIEGGLWWIPYEHRAVTAPQKNSDNVPDYRMPFRGI